MGLKIGYDGKFLCRTMRFGAHSGMSVHTRRLLEEMMGCKSDAQFTLYTLDGKPGMDLQSNCDVVELPGYARSSTLRNLIAYPVELQRRRIDVMMSYSTLPAYTPCKTVLLLDDVFWIANPGWLPKHIALPRTLATRRSVVRADRIVTSTEFSRREIVRLLNVPPEKIDVVLQGVRTDFVERLPGPVIAEVRDRHGIDGPYILSLNDIHPRKNIGGLVTAFERLKARTGLPHRLAIAGRTLWPYPELDSQIAASPFAADIKVLGYVPAADVQPLYQGASLFVYPSFYEGWGLQVHESMAAGIPVTVANNSTMVEIGGDAAGSFDPYDPDDMSRSIEEILTDPTKAAGLVAKGFERLKLYSWRRAAEETLATCLRVGNA